MTVGEWAQIAGATGTFAAVVVALFGQQLRPLVLPPRLKARLENDIGVEAADWVADDEPYISSRYFHLRITNPRRWLPITAVRVFLLRVEGESANGGAFDWEMEVPMQWRYPKDVPPALAIGFPRDCDLFSIAEDGRLRFKPAIPWALPPSIEVLRAPIDMQLTLQARGLEADSLPVRLAVSWDGTWPLDRIVVRELQGTDPRGRAP